MMGAKALQRLCIPARHAKGLMTDTRGQMTVEFVIAFPVMMIIAVIALNALLFFSECAAFDRLARQSICVHATSPAYGAGPSQLAAQVQADLESSFGHEWLAVSVESSGKSLGHVRYTAVLDFTPTLAGRSFSGKVFGVAIRPLHHEVSMVVDPYRPGAIA